MTADALRPAPGEPLRVLRVIARLNVGGPARQVTALSRHLDPVLFDHRLLAGDVGAGEIDDLELRQVSIPLVRVRGLGRSPRPADDVRALAGVVREIRRFRPHVVHTHTAKAGALGRVGASIASIAPARRPLLVHTFHGHLLQGYFSPPVRAAVVLAERLMAQRTDRLIAVGSRVRDELVAAGVGRRRPWDVVAPGVDLRPVPRREDARRTLGLGDGPVVAFVARLTAVKRPDRFVEVAARVTAQRPEVTFVVAGNGELADSARSWADAAGLGGSIRWLGWAADVEAVYAASDVVVLTSDNEGMPVSLIEAGLAARPAVTTDVGSASEVVGHERTGIVVAPGDIDALAAGVLRLIDDPERARAMGADAQRWAAERYSGARLAADTQRIYLELATGRGWR
ncbi:MAG TPA: glycosyltransferase [Acidimicrobiales bacterium]|nr:glycosyltransferase [Acidimicrobiales bacterium]